jgi:hypothetical protein
MWTHRFLILAVLIASVLPAHAFERPFPPNAKRGKMSPGIYPEIVIDGKMRLLSAGAKIWNKDNLLEQPASLRASGILVNYTVTPDGQIDRVWILTNEEAGRQ